MRALQGVPAAPGVAVGVVRRLDGVAHDETEEALAPSQRAAAVECATRALEMAAVELEGLAADLVRRHRVAEAEIVETGALMARDPGLTDAVRAAIEHDGRSPATAIVQAADLYAAALAAIDDPTLAARAADVRSVGRRAGRIAAGTGRSERTSGGDAILVTDDLGPADVAELEVDVRAIALARGGVTGHAAIIARSLGLPAIVGLGDVLLNVPEGCCVLVDGATGLLVVDPAADTLASARAAVAERRHSLDADTAARDLPAVTTDGHLVHVLANVSSAAELALALDAGAEGVGLLRTELAFLDAPAWPSVAEHRRMLEPLFRSLTERPTTVRILDFGADKLPPFLAGEPRRGVQLLRAQPRALEDQLEAILSGGSRTELRILIPMVIEPDDVRAVREAIAAVMRRQPGTRAPQIGAMIEVPAAVAMVRSIAGCVDFLSIGTNDLTHFLLGLDRATAGTAPAHHPAVLRVVAETLQAARDAGIGLEVCGEAASHPVAMPLLIGLGVDELSVGAARVGEVRRWVRSLDRSQCALIARRALDARNASEVEEISAPLRASLEVG
jgi:phosphoenolpyruvate-protein kinase (PTS system EI component)